MEVLSGLAFYVSQVSTFAWGFFGSCSVEIVALYLHYDSETPIPPRYRQPAFWIIRLLVSVIGGSLAIANGTDNNPILSMYIGASAPLIIQRFARGEKFELIN